MTECLLFVRGGDPVGVLCCLLGVAQDGLPGVAVVRFIQGDVFHDEGRQSAPVSCYSSAATCQEADGARTYGQEGALLTGECNRFNAIQLSCVFN